MSKSSSLVVLVSALLFSGTAFASTDINGLFDARSHAMGGTGVAFIDSPGAVPINPALLDQVKKYSVSLDVFGIRAQPTAPYIVWHQNPDGSNYQTYESVRSKPTGAPLPFLGVAYRLHERVVLGIATYPVIAQGTSAKYRPAPDQYPNLWATNKAAMSLLEAGDALSIRVLDNLSIALMWRINFMQQDVSTPVYTGGPPAGVRLNSITPGNPEVANAAIHVTGLNFTGFQFGVLWKPFSNLRLGFTYRNKVTVWGKGKTETPFGTSKISLPTQTNFTNPHSFRAGFALSALDEKLLFTFDFKYLLYAEAYKQIKSIVTMDGKDMTKYQAAYWKNSAVGQFGVEYKAMDKLAVRAGYTVLNTATNPDYALAFFAPAGISHLVTGGFGVKVMENLNIDAALGYVVVKTHIDTAPRDSMGVPTNAGIGTYSSKAVEMSLQATFHK